MTKYDNSAAEKKRIEINLIKTGLSEEEINEALKLYLECVPHHPINNLLRA